MKYNFDEYHERKSTHAIKECYLKESFGREDLLSMWVADMDFKTAEPIIKALEKRVLHGIYGYTAIHDGYYDAFVQWVDRRHQWCIEKEWLIYSPGVVPTLIFSIQAVTEVGDKIVIQSPVYGPFRKSIEDHDRQVVYNPLVFKEGRYQMDFEGLENLFKKGAKAMILCNPHNPVGRVWQLEELEKLTELLLVYDVYLISDEIHSDLILKGHKHIPIASMNENIRKRTITCMAPSKTFNLAGLQSSIVVVADEGLRNKLKVAYGKMDIHINNCFGQVAFETAYNEGEPWLNQLLDYIEANMDFAVAYIEDNIPEVKAYKPEGTYLMWLDFRNLNMNNDELNEFLINKAKVALNNGITFGEEGCCFVRLNLATTREKVEKSLQQIALAIKEENSL